VVFSAIASTQTTILPASRTLLSMARQQALPESLGRVHPRFLTPHVSTITVGVVATLWYVVLNSALEDFLAQTVAALSLMIAFYYSLTGFACVLYYRRELLRSPSNFVLIGVAPFIGAAVLAYLFVLSAAQFVTDPKGTSETGAVWLGVAPPLIIGIGFLLLGVVLMVVWRIGGHQAFFGRRTETVPRELVESGDKVAGATVGP
jgi:amino acid transporter